MANFHTNNLTIVASDEDMCKVLVRMAMNLAANRETTSFDLSSIENLDNARDLYYEVGPSIDAYYWCCFAGAPVSEEAMAGENIGWSSPTSSAGEFMIQLAEMQMAMQKLNAESPDVTNVELTVTAPFCRPLSDSASVRLVRYGENWVLKIDYGTAWAPNSEDVDMFFMGLPRGDYGVAFFDADEYDDYESITTFVGLHHGLAGMHDADVADFGVSDYNELKKQKKGYSSVSRSNIESLDELAKICAVCNWSATYWNDDEDDCADDGSYGGYEDEESVNFYDKPNTNWINPAGINWINPADKDLGEVDLFVVRELQKFPWLHYLDDGYFTAEGNAVIEALLPGDEVKIVAKWGAGQSSSDIVSFDVFDPKTNVKIAAFGTYNSFFLRMFDALNRWPSDPLAPVFACLLPYIHATVWRLAPVSLRSKGVDRPSLAVRFDFVEDMPDDIAAATREVLARDASERELSSVVREVM